MAGENNKLHIRLHVYDTDMPVYVNPEDEPYYRHAAKLITDTVNNYSDRYRTMKSEKEILYMALIDIALRLEMEKTHNDTRPYDDILAKITAEIENALQVGNTDSGTTKK
ncbi:MAG: cell division protein ZapA [Prevotellaceae bacterium]|nr:cell division protein ZapA [Prevotellaceae bacterium]